MSLEDNLVLAVGVLLGTSVLFGLFCVILISTRRRLTGEIAEYKQYLGQREQTIRDTAELLDDTKGRLHDNETKAQAREMELASKLKVAEMRAEEQLKQHQALNAELVKSQERIQRDFEALTAKIFEASRKKFEDESQKTLKVTLNPLKQEIEGFRKRIEETHREEIAGRSRLEGQIHEMQKQASQIGKDAVQLTAALKGEAKSQGDWGETILERLLEDSGLEKGREYDSQNSYKDEEGNDKRPDVIIHLPDNKDIVIDAKVSLKAYEAFFNAATDERREAALKGHLQSLRSHFTGLGKKEYEKLEGLKTLDFVFMFIPIEPACTLALQSDKGLFQQAYDRGVVIVSPTTLMVTLRTVANLWRYEKQNLNAREIADSAGGLYDQFTLLIESMDELGKKIDATQNTYEQARKRLSEGRGNVVRRVENLKKLGAKSKKNMPDSVRGLLEDHESVGRNQR